MWQLTVNVLGALTVGLCAVLLLRAYLSTRERLLMWSGMCFAGLTVANGLILVDLWIVPEPNLYVWRLVVAALSMLLLLYGLITESDQS